MEKSGNKKTFGLKEIVEECTRSESDISDQEQSEAESDISEVDSVEEDMFVDGLDAMLDRESDPDWEPVNVLAEIHVEMDEPSSKPETQAVPPQRGRGRGRCRGRGRERSRGRGRGRGRSRSRGRGASQPSTSHAAGTFGVEKPDITPTLPPFCVTQTPGPQLISTTDYTVLELFQLFFSSDVLMTLIRNTNVHGRSTYKTWADITLEDMFSFLAMVIYTGLLKVSALSDYWRQGRLYSLQFPKSVLTGQKFLAIVHALHLSSPEDDAKNEGKRGTAEFDRLGKIKPLYTEIRNACRQNYQLDQHIATDERMVASKARVIFKQYLKSKPVWWGFKLFVLADSKTGYTWDFFVYKGKSKPGSKKGLSYDSVMSLLNTSLSGTGFKLYVDNFYTSPVLFQDLPQKEISGSGFPRTTNNALDSRAPHGTTKWIREDPQLFVQWRDTVQDDAGHWTQQDVPNSPAIKDYNKHTGGVDLSDALIGYYEVLHKTKKWYKTFFYHFVDIAIVNAFILYKTQCKGKGIVPMHLEAFRETLVLELADAGSTRPPQAQQAEENRDKYHRLVYISSGVDKTQGRLRCRKCGAKTPVKCSTCDLALCFMPTRDCYNEWHIEQH